MPIAKLIKKPIYNYHIPLFRCGNIFKPESVEIVIHRTAGKHFFKPRRMWMRFLARLVLSLIWPIRLVRLAWRNSRRFGSEVYEKTGLSPLRQFFNQLYLGLVISISPIDYYRYEFFRPDNRRNHQKYLNDLELPSLLNACNRFIHPETISDKRMFNRRCKKIGLPTVEIFAEFENGRGPKFIVSSESGLIAKPALGCRGDGVTPWYSLGSDHYRSADGKVVSIGEIRADLIEKSREKPWILQPRLKNHAELEDLNNGVLCTVRIVTGLEGHVFGAVFKMPTGKAVTNTLGVYCAVDLNTGRLGHQAHSYRIYCPGFEKHPDTKAAFADRQLPYWPETLALVSQAQKGFPEARFIGWDVALTDDGPLLLEGNNNWDSQTMQRVLGPVLVEWLSQDARLYHKIRN